MVFHNAEITKNDLLRPVNWGKSSFYLLWYWGRDNGDHTGPLYPILWSTAFFLHIEHWSIVRPLVTTKPGWGMDTSVVTSQGQKDTMGAWEKSGARALPRKWYLIGSKLPDCNIGLQLVIPSSMRGYLGPVTVYLRFWFSHSLQSHKKHISEHILQKWEHYSGIVETFYISA